MSHTTAFQNCNDTCVVFFPLLPGYLDRKKEIHLHSTSEAE